MAFISIPNIKIAGVSACVPKYTEENKDYPYYEEGELEKMLPTVGILRRHVIKDDKTVADLCVASAEKLIEELKWDKSDIGLLLFASPARDYIEPDTACIIQDRLGLPDSCMAFDMTLGCTAWVYGMNVVGSIMSRGCIKKALLLVGDMPSCTSSYSDKVMYPLFSDAGSATALEFEEGAKAFNYELGTDGSGYEAIIIPDGGRKHPFSEKSLEMHNYGKNINHRDMDLHMDGMDVFQFALKRAPRSVANLFEHFEINKDDIDVMFIHQANLFMDKKICKKIGLPAEKVPYCVENFGNAGGCSLVLTMVTGWREKLQETYSKNLGCAFGVGLSWASIYFETNKIVVPELIQI